MLLDLQASSENRPPKSISQPRLTILIGREVFPLPLESDLAAIQKDLRK